MIKKTRGYRNALIEAGFNVKPNTKKPHGYWKNRENRIRAIRELVNKLGKAPRNITQKDFFRNGLAVVNAYYNGSCWASLKDAGYDLKPWEMKKFPLRIWNSKQNRIEAVKWLLNKLKKKPQELTYADFNKNRLYKLLLITKGVHNALTEAGYTVERKAKPRNYWKHRNNRIKYIKRLVNTIGKPPEEITYDDFANHKLYQLLEYYNCSAIEALKDAGYNLSPEIIKQRIHVNGRKIYASNHGHKFRSIFEKDLDNWFWNHGIKEHEHEKRYPASNMNCDFVIGDYWIEAVGLLREKWYEKKMQKKNEIANNFGIKLICISPEDFYNSYAMERKLAKVLRKHGENYNADLGNYGKN